MGARLATAGADVVYIQQDIDPSNDYAFVGSVPFPFMLHMCAVVLTLSRRVDKLVLVSGALHTDHLASDLLQARPLCPLGAPSAPWLMIH